MNRFKYIIYLFFIASSISTAQEKIDFSGKTVVIKGWAKQIAVSGHSENYIKIEEAQKNDKKDYDYEIGDSTITISLFPTCNTIGVVIPKNLNLKIDMEAVVYETMFDGKKGSDWRSLAISGINGNVESNTDGYNVALSKVNGSISVVSYGNISAVLTEFSNSELVSLDTYWGNVSLQIPIKLPANIRMRAVSGKLDISPKLKVTEKKFKTKKKLHGIINGGGLDIMLHSERGDVVSLLTVGKS